MAITTVNNNIYFEDVINMFGIDPLQFNGLYPACIDDPLNNCEQFWTQFFESGKITSREELAQELLRAEIEVANYLNQWPFKTYICDEHIEFESCYRNKNQLGINLINYTFKTKWECVDQFGTFSDIKLGTGSVTLLDADNDGFKETAEVVFDYSGVTEQFTFSELKLAFPSYYQYNNTINPILNIEQNNLSSTITFTVNSWNLINPELYIYREFAKTSALDACNEDNYVTEVDILIKKKTPCAPDGYIYYDNPNCSGNCDEISYPFCANIVDKHLGLFKILPGYIDDNDCFVSDYGCLPSRKPKRIEVNYISGCSSCDNISNCNLLKRAIIYLAVSRLPRTLCECGCSSEFLEELKFDTSITYSNSSVKFNYPFSLRETAYFGTKIGELEAIKILNNLRDKLC